MAKEIIILTNKMANKTGHKLGNRSKMRVRKQVYDLCTTISQVARWADVAVLALAFEDLSGYTQLEDVSWVYTALEDVYQSNETAEHDWDAATEERVCHFLKALNDAKEVPVASEKVLQVILKALFLEGLCSIPAVKLLCRAKSWFTDIDLQPIMQEHNVWSRMGSVFMNTSWELRDWVEGYFQLSEKLSSLTQWTPYIHRNLPHWVFIYSLHNTKELQSSFLSVLEHIWGVKYTGTYPFAEKLERTLAWTQIALIIVWESFDFSGQQTLQDIHPLIRTTISTAFTSHNPYNCHPWAGALIPPKFRATFSIGLGDALIQAARKADDVISQTPTQIENQPDLDSSPQDTTHVFHRAARLRLLDEIGQILKLESKGEQVDCGEEMAREYWDNLRTHFEQQVNELELSLKETPGTAELSR
ncbi:hypothetical protein C8J57DRAFT_1613821 [Mycena rebaudengoi]|nr:hypothetical protein C8J57DRAFT_1613821 [Mycena rebaudengoi]